MNENLRTSADSDSAGSGTVGAAMLRTVPEAEEVGGCCARSTEMEPQVISRTGRERFGSLNMPEILRSAFDDCVTCSPKMDADQKRGRRQRTDGLVLLSVVSVDRRICGAAGYCCVVASRRFACSAAKSSSLM